MCTAELPELAGVAPIAELPDLAELIEYAVDLLGKDKAPGTRATYAAAWSSWGSWCASYGLPELPADPRAVVTYLASLERRGLAASTLGVRLAAIGWYHQQAGHPSPSSSPLVKIARAAWRLSLGTDARAPRRALGLVELAEMINATGGDVKGCRDRALLLLGFAGGFRKSELIGLTVDDVIDVGPDLAVRLVRSKGKQTASRYVGIPFSRQRPELCPVRAVRAWKLEASVDAGALLRSVDRHDNVSAAPLSGRSVGRIMKDVAKPGALAAGVAAGIEDPDVLDEYVKGALSRLGAHSLRRGFITAARAAGRPLDDIARHVGHKRIDSTRGYVEVMDSLGADNPARFVLG